MIRLRQGSSLRKPPAATVRNTSAKHLVRIWTAVRASTHGLLCLPKRGHDRRSSRANPMRCSCSTTSSSRAEARRRALSWRTIEVTQPPRISPTEARSSWSGTWSGSERTSIAAIISSRRGCLPDSTTSIDASISKRSASSIASSATSWPKNELTRMNPATEYSQNGPSVRVWNSRRSIGCGPRFRPASLLIQSSSRSYVMSTEGRRSASAIASSCHHRIRSPYGSSGLCILSELGELGTPDSSPSSR